ncbi:hypothetical protein C8F04DRAFT_1188021 [Mycena alexandri]|uniref:Uncharacterized protein n=1 Tax=Mycena alexandri TaxID=1745969 RepID=A0AAD6WZC1_9AGAR|nr:hypothetical protein C8F04DRAFT_1188021 [Mycena alexandri]
MVPPKIAYGVGQEQTMLSTADWALPDGHLNYEELFRAVMDLRPEDAEWAAQTLAWHQIESRIKNIWPVILPRRPPCPTRCCRDSLTRVSLPSFSDDELTSFGCRFAASSNLLNPALSWVPPALRTYSMILLAFKHTILPSFSQLILNKQNSEVLNRTRNSYSVNLRSHASILHVLKEALSLTKQYFIGTSDNCNDSLAFVPPRTCALTLWNKIVFDLIFLGSGKRRKRQGSGPKYLQAAGDLDVAFKAGWGLKRRWAFGSCLQGAFKRPALLVLGRLWLAPKRVVSSGRSSVIAGEEDFDTPMSQYGGPSTTTRTRSLSGASREEGKCSERGRRVFSSSQSILKITAVPPKPATQKALRGDAKKWTLGHLPTGTSDRFTSAVVPLARERCGTLEGWASLTVHQLQDIVNRVFKQGILRADNKTRTPIAHVVKKNGPWWGLISYRLEDWRAAFATQATKNMVNLIRIQTAEEEAENAIAAGADASDLFPDPGESFGPHSPAIIAPRSFLFRTAQGITDFVTWARQVHEQSGTQVFHREMWGGGVDKKGLFMSHLILQAYVSHLNFLDTIPAEYTRTLDPPYGALLMAVQAVDRNLLYWATDADTFGNHKNYAPREQVPCDAEEVGRETMGRFREGTEEWQEKKIRRAASSSRGSSEAEEEVLEEDEEEFIVVSD